MIDGREGLKRWLLEVHRPVDPTLQTIGEDVPHLLPGWVDSAWHAAVTNAQIAGRVATHSPPEQRLCHGLRVISPVTEYASDHQPAAPLEDALPHVAPVRAQPDAPNDLPHSGQFRDSREAAPTVSR